MQAFIINSSANTSPQPLGRFTMDGVLISMGASELVTGGDFAAGTTWADLEAQGRIVGAVSNNIVIIANDGTVDILIAIEICKSHIKKLLGFSTSTTLLATKTYCLQYMFDFSSGARTFDGTATNFNVGLSSPFFGDRFDDHLGEWFGATAGNGMAIIADGASYFEYFSAIDGGRVTGSSLDPIGDGSDDGSELIDLNLLGSDGDNFYHFASDGTFDKHKDSGSKSMQTDGTGTQWSGSALDGDAFGTRGTVIGVDNEVLFVILQNQA